MWLLGFDLRTSGRAFSALNLWAISAASPPTFFFSQHIFSWLDCYFFLFSLHVYMCVYVCRVWKYVFVCVCVIMCLCIYGDQKKALGILLCNCLLLWARISPWMGGFTLIQLEASKSQQHFCAYPLRAEATGLFRYAWLVKCVLGSGSHDSRVLDCRAISLVP